MPMPQTAEISYPPELNVRSSVWIPVVWMVAVFALIVNAIVASYNVGRVLQNERVILHTRNVQAGLAQILSELVDAETGQRGFLITSDDVYLQPYESARRGLPGQMRAMRDLLTDNPEQLARFDHVEHLIQERMAILEFSVQQIRDQQTDVAFESIKAGRGLSVMNQLRERIAEMQAVEETHLSERSRQSNVQFQTTLVTIVLGTTISLAVVGLAYFVIGQELTRRKDAEQAVRAINDRLETTVSERTSALVQTSAELLRSNRELEQFAYVASHDLQEPLRKIQAFGDRLKKATGDTLPEASREYVDRMQASATRMRTLISDLLTYSRVSTQNQAFRPVNLSEILAGVQSDLVVRIEECGGRIDADPLPTINADPTQMQQLFQNLIGNALKFRRAEIPPVIRITCRPLADVPTDENHTAGSRGWRILVTDNGIGFETQYADRIFGLFQRLHGRGEYDGTGIGLSICRKIVERHGGRITANSQPGVGTEFVIDLPELTAPMEPVSP
jgi:signal transduction histidine kinase